MMKDSSGTTTRTYYAEDWLQIATSGYATDVAKQVIVDDKNL